MTLAGWDEKASRAAAADPQTPREVLDYFITPDNLRPALLPALVENPSVPESHLVKLAASATHDSIEVMLKSGRVKSSRRVLETLKGNPYLKKEDAAEIEKLKAASVPATSFSVPAAATNANPPESTPAMPGLAAVVAESVAVPGGDAEASTPEHEEAVSAYFKDHANEIAAEGEKPFQSIGGVVELLGTDYFPVTQTGELAADTAATPTQTTAAAAKPAPIAHKKPQPPGQPKRENALQKINGLDVKGRIQLALKGNKEERSLLIRDGTKVVALAVLEAPKLSDGEVEKFASQKNVLEAVLRQIPLKRRFMKNYIVVRNLVANPRTPLDLGLGLMKNLLVQDLKNISGNKEVSETIRKLALKMYKQKMEDANKK
jgi:hypothetical protein